MNRTLCLYDLDLSCIDFKNYTYSISPDFDATPDETLKESIARHGILNPPLVRETGSGTYAIVSGRKRLLAFRSVFAGINSCCCLLIPTPTAESEVFSILLEEAQITRQLTPIERAFFLSRISSVVDPAQIVAEFLPRLGLPPNPFHMRQSLSLLSLDGPIVAAIHTGFVSEAAALDIAALSSQDRAAVFGVISPLRLSFSNQKKLLNLCRELAIRENKGIAEILENAEIREILDHRDANPPQKAKNLMTLLASWHKPRATRAEEEFKCFAASLQLTRGVAVDHTPFFEDDAVTLSMTFSNRRSLQHVWEKIRDALRKQDN